MLKTNAILALFKYLAIAPLVVLLFACGNESSLKKDNSIAVIDDFGRTVSISQPAERIVALSPHIVENLFSAGLGDRIVAAVDSADFPPAAIEIPRVGGFANFSLESIIAFNPDLVVGWGSGYAGFEQLIERLETVGIAIYVDEPKTLFDISRSVKNFATLGATTAATKSLLHVYETRLHELRQRYEKSEAVKVFYPIWPKPLQTLNREHIVNDVIELCGGRNLFADAAVLAPVINTESVLARNPGVIIASASNNARPFWLDDWYQWSTIDAVRKKQLYFVPGDLLSRHTLRMLEGAEKMCNYIESARTLRQNGSALHAR